jgi:hypothetical protein
MTRAARIALAVLPLLLVAACGSAAPGGGASTGSTAPYANPSAGPLRTYATIEELATALSPDCHWTFKKNDASTPDSAWCEPESLSVGLAHDPEAQTVEQFRTTIAKPGYWCEWWGYLELAYSLMRGGGGELYSAAGVTPTDLPTTTTSVETPAGVVFGGNWWTTYGTASQGESIGTATQGYVVPAPTGCSSTSASPTSSATRSDERTACSSSATTFLATLVREGLPGVTVETVPERGPRPMDATTCMADYIAQSDPSQVQGALAAYLTSLGYSVVVDTSGAGYDLTKLIATAKGKPRVEVQLAFVGAETPATAAPFEVLLADG